MGVFYRTASGVSVSSLVELRSFQGYDGNGLCRSLNGRLTGVHKVLCRAREIALQRTKRFLLEIRRWFHVSSVQQQWP